MTLPKAAQKQVDEANKLHEEVYSTGKEAENKDPKPEPDLKTGGQGDDGTLPKGDAGKAQPQDKNTPPDGGWEHKYKTLQGMYNADTSRLTSTIATQTAQINEMAGRLRDLEENQAAPATGAPDGATSLLSADEISDYGEDMIKMVKKAAREELNPVVESLTADNERLKKENEDLKRDVGGFSESFAQSAKEQMYAKLAARVPNWETVNTDQEFLSWLQHADPFSGQLRQQMLADAHAASNAERVIAFFEGFLRERGGVGGNLHDHSSTAPKPKVTMDTLVAPGKTTTSPAPVGNGSAGQPWTQAQINAFYRDVQRGVYRNNATEKLKIEKEILKAGREGRISA